ncbi:MAG: DNA polymerase III subunit beta [Planctomycetota bacterium]
MRVLCQTRSLQEAIQLVAGVVPANATRPILLCVFLKAEADHLVVQGTDLEAGLSVRIDEVEVAEPGVAAVAVSGLNGILRETRDEQVQISLAADGGTIEVKSERSLFKVPTQQSEQFPELSFNPPTPSVRVGRETLLRCLRLTAIAAAKDTTRFQMHSVLVERSDDVLRLVSTDGKRMAIAESMLPSGQSDVASGSQYIVPLKGVELLVRILGLEDAEEVALHLGDNEVTYNSDNVSLFCRLVEGKFPEYSKAVPPPGGNTYEFSCDDLMVALRQASLMTTKETNSVLFSFEGPSLVLSTRAADVGESRVELGIEPVESSEDALAINFNPAFVIDLLRAVDDDTIRGRFQNQRTAGIFEFENESMNYRHIVMPLVAQQNR